MALVTWREAWQQALYGAGGFYRRPGGPAGHFTTATHGVPGQVVAAAIASYAAGLGASLIVDVGAGRGELLAQLHRAGPALRLCGVEVVSRPDGLDRSIGWLTSPGGPHLPDELAGLQDVLVVAHEWLDVVPCTLAEVGRDGVLRELVVEPASGRTSPGDPVRERDLLWCERFWPAREPGDRVEVGRARDLAWADLLDRVERGTALAVDYGHRVGDRPREGSLTAYRDGVQVPPVPDGSCDLTAHVAVDSLRHHDIRTQRVALRGLGVTGRTPDHALSGTDPAAYLEGLARASAEATLIAEGGFGDFHWVVASVDG